MTAISTIITWLNDNNGALMVLITVIYVIATISISHSNRKSAEASRKQLEASQKQQEQNVGLQLYDRRKEVIDKLSQDKYDEIYWDIGLLFNVGFLDSLALEQRRVQIVELQKEVFTFENEFGILFGENEKHQIENLRREVKNSEDVVGLCEYIGQRTKDCKNNISNSVEHYLEQVLLLQEKISLQEAEKEKLLHKLRVFVSNSIHKPQ